MITSKEDLKRIIKSESTFYLQQYAKGKKNKIMRNVESGKINILISTTVIEVGVNVPNASMIVIFNANLFGLSTLHQLRGRVGRGNIQSYCVLLAHEYSERLKMLEEIERNNMK